MIDKLIYVKSACCENTPPFIIVKKTKKGEYSIVDENITESGCVLCIKSDHPNAEVLTTETDRYTMNTSIKIEDVIIDVGNLTCKSPNFKRLCQVLKYTTFDQHDWGNV
jgi:hypothetical protein